MQRIQCGTYKVPETKVFHYAGYECAAWWQDIQVEAGEYPVFALLENDRVKWFTVSLPGTVVDANFQGYYCGMPIGKYDKTKDINIPGSYHIQSYDYCVFDSIKNDPQTVWSIDTSLLPNLGTCIDCGSFVTLYVPDQKRRCPSCSVKAEDIRTAAIRVRYPRILAALHKYNYKASRYFNIFDYTIDRYKESVKAGDVSTFHQGEVKTTIANVRRLQHADRARQEVSV